MNKEDFVKALKFLGTAYNKEFDKDQVEVWYSFLMNYNYETLKDSIKEIIKTRKYIPTINEMIEICEKTKKEKRYDILEKMKSEGYFKTIEEYEKASMWMERNIIPNWFREDMKKYYTLLLQSNIKQISE